MEFEKMKCPECGKPMKLISSSQSVPAPSLSDLGYRKNIYECPDGHQKETMTEIVYDD